MSRNSGSSGSWSGRFRFTSQRAIALWSMSRVFAETAGSFACARVSGDRSSGSQGGLRRT
eukprot:7386560-Prymnesium_polylepis.1